MIPIIIKSLIEKGNVNILTYMKFFLLKVVLKIIKTL